MLTEARETAVSKRGMLIGNGREGICRGDGGAHVCVPIEKSSSCSLKICASYFR